MYRVDRNNYVENAKKTTIETPEKLAKFIVDTISPHILDEHTPTKIIDICCNRGRLLQPFVDYPYKNNNAQYKFKLVGVDIIDLLDSEKLCDFEFVKTNFLRVSIDLFGIFKPDLILCNPPFNYEVEKTKGFLPEIFCKKIFDTFGYQVPLILFTPIGFLFNNRINSRRLAWLKYIKEYYGTTITSRIVLPLDVFTNYANYKDYKDAVKLLHPMNLSSAQFKFERKKLRELYGIVEFHSEILIFNIPNLEPVYYF